MKSYLSGKNNIFSLRKVICEEKYKVIIIKIKLKKIMELNFLCSTINLMKGQK